MAIKCCAGQPRTVVLHRDQDVHLENFRVSSNSIGLLHSEQMTTFDGTLQLVPIDAESVRPERWELVNDTPLTLEGIGVLHEKEAAWLDKLGPGERSALEFKFDPTSDAWQDLRDRASATARVAKPGVANLRKLVDLAETGREPGESHSWPGTRRRFPAWRSIRWPASSDKPI